MMRATMFLLGCLTVAAAAQPGSIRGSVEDSETGDPLPGVNILVQGTYSGAVSDLDGSFLIPDLNPGDYTLEITMIGYKVTRMTGVKVSANAATPVAARLEPTVLALGQEIVIVGEQPLFDIEETASRKAFTAEDIAGSIVQNVEDIVSSQAGVVAQNDEIHIRGGRSYEAAYLLDGLNVQDPLSGTGFGLRVAAGAIEEMEVITGGFNAEYGQAMSGVVNVSTKEGGTRYRGSLGYKLDHFGFNGEAKSNFNTDVFEFTLQGAEPLTRYALPALGIRPPGKFSLFFSGHLFVTDSYAGFTADQLRSSIFHGSTYAPRQDNDWSGLFKTTWQIDPTHKLIASYNRSIRINQNTQSLQTNLEYVPPGPGYPYEFQYNLDNFDTFTHDNVLTALTWIHTLGKSTFYDVRLSRFFTHLRSDVAGKHWTEYTEPQDIVTLPLEYYMTGDSLIMVIPGDGFYDFGNGFTWHDHHVEEYTAKASISSNRGSGHKVKAGIEATAQEMQLVDIYAPWYGDLGLNNDIYTVHPSFGAAYLQDNITFSGMLANLGLRFDWWFPGAFVERAVDDTTIATIPQEARDRFNKDTYGFFGRRWKGRISPRVGISHPVSDNQMLFFSYGHFNKRPKPQFIYAKLGPNSAQSTFQKFGNPNLDLETTVAYELGVRQKFTQDDVLSVTAYYKDIFDYVTTISVKGEGRLSGKSFITYVNLDYARVRGLELEYKKRAGRYLTGRLSGSYSLATGKSSSSDDAYLVARGQLDEKPIKETTLVWDRPLQLSADLFFNVPAGDAPGFFGLTLPDDWSASLRLFLQSGKRYTPYIATGDSLADGRPNYVSDYTRPYSRLGQHWHWVDFNLTKYFSFGGMKQSVELEILNILDRRNSNIINPVTGRAYELGDPTPPGWNDPLYPDRQDPVQPYPFNPARYLSPRNIRVGFNVAF
ncbi:TonB-dependent receptor [Candidatus Fermentibacteria bacterium]|nr:TonB-dependent receptor [Candidatus Fermentibacteria bacterium]